MSSSERLDEVGPYETDGLPYMNFECPGCGFTLCEWTQCPECGWYDGEAWEATMAEYVDCAKCGQTTLDENTLGFCESCLKQTANEAAFLAEDDEEAREVLRAALEGGENE